jgi:hypothetical protein
MLQSAKVGPALVGCTRCGRPPTRRRIRLELKPLHVKNGHVEHGQHGATSLRALPCLCASPQLHQAHATAVRWRVKRAAGAAAARGGTTHSRGLWRCRCATILPRAAIAAGATCDRQLSGARNAAGGVRQRAVLAARWNPAPGPQATASRGVKAAIRALTGMCGSSIGAVALEARAVGVLGDAGFGRARRSTVTGGRACIVGVAGPCCDPKMSKSNCPVALRRVATSSSHTKRSRSLLNYDIVRTSSGRWRGRDVEGWTVTSPMRSCSFSAAARREAGRTAAARVVPVRPCRRQCSPPRPPAD